MKRTAFLLVFGIVFLTAVAQHKTENVVIVTLDGMRWQEVFGGVDEVLMNDSVFNRNRNGIQENSGQLRQRKKKKIVPFFMYHHCGSGTDLWKSFVWQQTGQCQPLRVLLSLLK